jgi:uncharacterized membrane protein
MMPPAGPAKGTRRTYLDVLRGVAVLVMIEAHVIDSWTHVADRLNPAFGKSLIVGGFGAPLFLLLAGVAVALSAGSKARRLGDAHAAVRAVEKRGLEIFALAFLFRLQAMLISMSPPWTLLKVDILNIMGPAIVLTAWLWGIAGTQRRRLVIFAAATAIIAFATPIVRGLPWLARLPDFLEGYLRPIPNLTNFAAFPWLAFVPAGAFVGVLIDDAREPSTERRVNIGLGAGGLTVAIASYWASYYPSPFAHSSFWTSSPSFFFLRLGLLVAAVAIAYAWERRPSAGRRWSPLRLLGRTSLFIYWIHVEMVYGIISTPLHGGLSLRGAWTALAIFWLFMVLCAIAKERAVRWWKAGGFGTGGSPSATQPEMAEA